MTLSNLPPGCTSDDGGINHAMESALETLCDNIDTVECAKALAIMAPIIQSLIDKLPQDGADMVLVPREHLSTIISWAGKYHGFNTKRSECPVCDAVDVLRPMINAKEQEGG